MSPFSKLDKFSRILSSLGEKISSANQVVTEQNSLWLQKEVLKKWKKKFSFLKINCKGGKIK